MLQSIVLEIILFQLTSKDFKENDKIPSEFTCDGKNVSPHLSWSDPPENTKSFALSVTDPDSASGLWIHWLVYNIPGNLKEIQRGNLTIEAKELENDFGKNTYGGPCPSSGTHRYFFTLYALSANKIKDLTKENFFDKIKGYVINKTEIMGYYERK